ncbi:methyltransferase domain-containing protein [Gracilibacillus massiliensis]|uniref:methyltransferase domain-containing protein n=1 Tax=Gracilibacillus massiliensis TaxID=1564956 RepID=UPI00071E522E|nr:methyltransferase domain-containing protein [Gracilibacillus massiliensis]
MTIPEENKKLDLNRIVYIGRTFDEYIDMFALSDDFLKGKRILDCPAGACSFTAIGNKKGYDITACDIAYYYDVEELKDKGLQDIEHAMETMRNVRDNYKWEYFKDIESLRRHRLSALHDVTNDRREAKKNYIPAALPQLPFEDNSFDVLLSAHFLFMYADRLNYQFHIDTLNELLRVTKDHIRIFPLVDLEGNTYKSLDKTLHYLEEIGCTTEIVQVPYEFQIHANSMLIISKGMENDKL